jgi:predicted naringenin-chalcone synthase
MYLNGLATAVPPRRFTQAECWTALQQSPQFPQLNPRAHTVLRKVLSGDNGIATRHLAVAELGEAFMSASPTTHPRWPLRRRNARWPPPD